MVQGERWARNSGLTPLEADSSELSKPRSQRAAGAIRRAHTSAWIRRSEGGGGDQAGNNLADHLREQVQALQQRIAELEGRTEAQPEAAEGG